MEKKLSVSQNLDQSDDREFWQGKTPQERLDAVELMRQILYGYDPTSERLQRIFAVAERPPR
jgi:hypothetical protein